MRRFARVAVSLSCPLLAIATLSGLSGAWTIPLAIFCMVNAVLAVAEDRRKRADDAIVLNLHR